jgi:nitrogen regulatory protein P-II 1
MTSSGLSGYPLAGGHCQYSPQRASRAAQKGYSDTIMVKIEAIIQPFKLDDVKAALEGIGIAAITIYPVVAHGGMLGQKVFYRGAEYIADAPRVKVEMLASSLMIDEVIDVVSRAARSGTSGDDGAILISELADAVSIHSGQRVRFTLS